MVLFSGGTFRNPSHSLYLPWNYGASGLETKVSTLSIPDLDRSLYSSKGDFEASLDDQRDDEKDLT